MRLTRVQVTEFQSIRDSNSFEVGDVTCLVGKNEAGKTAVLTALYRLNPYIETEGTFDVTDDYPRRDVEDYRHAVETAEREVATVIRATFHLGEKILSTIAAEIGPDALTSAELTLSKGYENSRKYSLTLSADRALSYLLKNADAPDDIAATLSDCTTVEAALEVLGKTASSPEVSKLQAILQGVRKDGMSTYIYNKHIKPVIPKFVYFDEYYQMKGADNIEQLKQRLANNQLEPSDRPLLGLIELARLNLDELLNPGRTQELQNKLEGAGNHLSKKVLKYWSQNRHISMRFDVRQAQPKDPAGMRTGTNIWAKVHDSRHQVSTDLGTRSRGFVWFFSFLAWYSQIQRRNENVILLLDEPGLSLHGRAQEDLLRYFETELAPHHQLIYTTHSPFMVDPRAFHRVRIVEDRGIDAEAELPLDQDGTKVLSEALEASRDSLFPLQGALGYEIYQALFVGPNSLIVEGVSDLLYIQTLSGILGAANRETLDSRWTITPVGGAEKVPTFVALLGAQKGLKIATLIDFQAGNRQSIENLFKRKLLKKNHVITFADITGKPEADIEDLFDAAFFLDLVNAEYAKDLGKPVVEADLPPHPRILVRLEKYFEANPMKAGAVFNHYRPARHLAERGGALAPKLSAGTVGHFEAAFKLLNALL